MDVAKHAKADNFLVAVEEGSETLSVLVATLVWNVANQDSIPSHLLNLLQVVRDESQLLIWVFKRVPQHQVVKVAALCVQRDDSCLQIGQILRIVAMLVPAVPLGLGYPLT